MYPAASRRIRPSVPFVSFIILMVENANNVRRQKVLLNAAVAARLVIITLINQLANCVHLQAKVNAIIRIVLDLFSIKKNVQFQLLLRKKVFAKNILILALVKLKAVTIVLQKMNTLTPQQKIA